MTTPNSPYAFRLKASNCLCCGRDLTDPESIKRGIGPVCVKKYGYGTADGHTNLLKAKVELRKLEPALKDFILDVPVTANRDKDIYAIAEKLVYNISAMGAGYNRDLNAVAAMINSLNYLGFVTLAEKVSDNILKVKFVRDDENSEVHVFTSYDPAFISAVKTINYKERRFDRDTKAWVVKYTSARKLYELVKDLYKGHIGYSEKEGLFIVS